jgi:hypothetical protein
VAEKNTRDADDPISEILATSGLVTMMGAVVVAVVAVVTLGEGDAALAAVLGTVAVASFVVSLACFFSDSNRAEEKPLPFPSWLRGDAKAAQELSA